MKLNKKGMTLVEIIISIALISIVLVFLFSLLVDVKDMNDEASINSDYLINKALILKNIEEDLDETTSLKISTCEINDFYTTYPKMVNITSTTPYFVKETNEDADVIKKRQASECIKFIFNNDNSNVAHLGIYYYKNKDSYVISYIHGNTKATRLLPEFEKYNVYLDKDKNVKKRFIIKYSNSNNPTTRKSITGEMELKNDIFHKIEIPIIGSDGKDYSIIISYYKKS